MAAGDLAFPVGFTTESQWRSYSLEDVDGDGDIDFLATFPTQTTWIGCDTFEAGIHGQTFDGQEIFGFDSVNPVGKDCKDNNEV